MKRYLKTLMPSHYLVVPDLNSEFKPEELSVFPVKLKQWLWFNWAGSGTPHSCSLPHSQWDGGEKSKKVRWGEIKTV